MLDNNKSFLAYEGKIGSLYWLTIKNLFLKIITLGFYRFWGKTKIRKYIMQNLSLMGEQFEYIGTGKELFIGFLKTLPFYILVTGTLLTLSYLLADNEITLAIIIYSTIPFFIFIIGVAVYASLRYRFSRITWRGIRFGMSGSAWTYGKMVLKHSLLNLVTFGILIPKNDLKENQYILQNVAFGSEKAEIEDLSTDGLMKIHFITLILAPFTLGFSRCWYQAYLTNYVYSKLKLGELRFAFNFSGSELLNLIMGNFLIVLLTLGLGAPYALHRYIKFFVKHFAIIGQIETAHISQSQERLLKSGEGLESLFDDAALV